MATRLLFARHGETAVTAKGQFIGITDLPLSTVGREQAKTLARTLQGHSLGKIFVSPLHRCRETAAIATAAIQLPLEYLDDLREIDFGTWEGMTFPEIAAHDPELVNRWASWSLDFSFPGGEAIGHFLARIHGVADQLRACPEEVVLVIAHGGVIRALLCHLLNLPPQNYLLFEVQPARLTVVDLYNEGGVLVGLNL